MIKSLLQLIIFPLPLAVMAQAKAEDEIAGKSDFFMLLVDVILCAFRGSFVLLGIRQQAVGSSSFSLESWQVPCSG